MQPGAHATIPGFPGLRIVASATRRTWIYRYKSPVDGRMRQIKLGEWPAMAYAAAIAAWETARSSRDSGVDASMVKRREARHAPDAGPQAYCVRDLCRDYLTGHVERVRKSSKNTRLLFSKLPESFANMRPQDVTRRCAYDLIESRMSAPTMAALLRGELGAAWAYGLDSGRIPEETPNWWREILRGKIVTAGKPRAGERILTKRVLSDAEVGALLRWLPKAEPVLRDVITLYLWTGARGGEILSMEGHEITREDDGVWWTIPKEKTKNAKAPHATDLRVPLIGRALEVVQNRERKGPMFDLLQRHVISLASSSTSSTFAGRRSTFSLARIHPR
ncbi:hypothetical protein WI72_33665 [Burkholderia ubonensis]|nr:hypothetical protein WI72_33665 [Burkholderia ubonensis]